MGQTSSREYWRTPLFGESRKPKRQKENLEKIGDADFFGLTDSRTSIPRIRNCLYRTGRSIDSFLADEQTHQPDMPENRSSPCPLPQSSTHSRFHIIKMGVDVKTISRRFGHGSVRFTPHNYGHIYLDRTNMQPSNPARHVAGGQKIPKKVPIQVMRCQRMSVYLTNIPGEFDFKKAPVFTVGPTNKCRKMVEGEGFEPPKGVAQQIYSLPPLTELGYPSEFHCRLNTPRRNYNPVRG